MSSNIPTAQVSSVKPLFDYLKKQKENRRFLKSLEIAATFFLITFFMFFAVRPTILTIASLQGEIQSKKLLKDSLKNKINDVIKAQDLFSQVQERYQVVNSSLPDSPKYYDAANQIQNQALAVGITVDRLGFDLQQNTDPKKLPDANLRTYGLSLSINTPFPPALKLISGLLENRRLLSLDTLFFGNDTINLTASPSASGGITTRFTSTFYYWPPPANVKK